MAEEDTKKKIRLAQKKAFNKNLVNIKSFIETCLIPVLDELCARGAISDEVKKRTCLDTLVTELQNRLGSSLDINLFDAICDTFDSIDSLNCLSIALRKSVNDILKYEYYKQPQQPELEVDYSRKDSGKGTDSFLSLAQQASEDDVLDVENDFKRLQIYPSSTRSDVMIPEAIHSSEKLRLEEEKRDVQKQLEIEQKDKEILEEARSRTMKKLQSAQERNISLQTEDKENTEIIDELTDKYRDLERKKSLSETKLEIAQRDIVNLKRENQKLKSEQKRWMDQSLELQLEVEKLKSKLTDQEKIIEELRKQNIQSLEERSITKSSSEESEDVIDCN